MIIAPMKIKAKAHILIALPHRIQRLRIVQNRTIIPVTNIKRVQNKFAAKPKNIKDSKEPAKQ
jgi:hypothetical protein